MSRIFTALFLVLALAAIGRPAAAQSATDPRLGERMLGDPKAAVRIDEYASLSCTHCAEFSTETLPKLQADYIDKKQVKLVFHDFPLNDVALKAAVLARCVPAERFFPFIETLYKTQKGWAFQPGLDALKQQAKFAGLSDGQIDTCLADKALEDGVLHGQLDAQKTPGVNATPTFVLNQDPANKIEGALPYDQFKDKIDALLKGAHT